MAYTTPRAAAGGVGVVARCTTVAHAQDLHPEHNEPEGGEAVQQDDARLELAREAVVHGRDDDAGGAAWCASQHESARTRHKNAASAVFPMAQGPRACRTTTLRAGEVSGKRERVSGGCGVCLCVCVSACLWLWLWLWLWLCGCGCGCGCVEECEQGRGFGELVVGLARTRECHQAAEPACLGSRDPRRLQVDGQHCTPP